MMGAGLWVILRSCMGGGSRDAAETSSLLFLERLTDELMTSISVQ